jgi:lysylphosphatidylglycerol synthetase-like protein (DUF2156 family)
MLKTTENELMTRETGLLITYGTAASEAMFDFPCNFFRIPDCEGAIPYRIESGCAIVIGEPLCPANEMDQLVEAFHQHCHSSHLRVIYLIVSETFARLLQDRCPILIEACEELIIDPQSDPCQTSHRLKHRVEKAAKHGLTVHEYIPSIYADPEIENALKQIAIKWQEAIKGPNIYLGHLNFFESYSGKRWFYVKDGEQITSMIMLSRLEVANGWLLKFLITLPGAFHETSEFLMTSVLEVLRKENCHFLTKGVVPADYLREIDGMNAFARWNVRCMYQLINWVFKFKKRKAYWLRYNPQKKPTYVLFEDIRLNELKALIKVFRSNFHLLHH